MKNLTQKIVDNMVYNYKLVGYPKLEEIDIVLLNLSAGMPTSNLTEREVQLLIDEYGPDWMEEIFTLKKEV